MHASEGTTDCLHVEDSAKRLLESIDIRCPDDLFANFNEQPHPAYAAESLDKPGLETWRQRWRLTLPNGTHLYLKRFVQPPSSSRRAFRHLAPHVRSLAGLEAYWMRRLRRSGIPTIVPIAWTEQLDVQRRKEQRSREQRSAILMHAVPGQSLEAWCAKPAVALAVDREDVLRHVAVLASRLHGLGLFHRDLYLSHIFYERPTQIASEAARTDEPMADVHLIDLTRMVEDRPGALRRRIKDLAALNHSTPVELVSNAQRVRWLKLYLQTPKLTPQYRRLLYRVVGRTASMKRHDRKRQRRLAVD